LARLSDHVIAQYCVFPEELSILNNNIVQSCAIFLTVLHHTKNTFGTHLDGQNLLDLLVRERGSANLIECSVRRGRSGAAENYLFR
jgi:hypothetical protein